MSKRIRELFGLRSRLFFILITSIFMLLSYGHTAAQEKTPIVRLAKLLIDSSQLENYKAALREGIETAVRTEPGVLSLYAVYDINNPTHVTVLEIYADADAYKAHLETTHFKKYKRTTMAMVKSLELTETVPIALGTKRK